MSETIKTLHGTTIDVGADATKLQPSDLGALIAFHHWRDFMRGRSADARNRPSDVDGYFFPNAEATLWAQAAYRRHWRNDAFREAAR